MKRPFDLIMQGRRILHHGQCAVGWKEVPHIQDSELAQVEREVDRLQFECKVAEDVGVDAAVLEHIAGQLAEWKGRAHEIKERDNQWDDRKGTNMFDRALLAFGCLLSLASGTAAALVFTPPLSRIAGVITGAAIAAVFVTLLLWAAGPRKG